MLKTRKKQEPDIDIMMSIAYLFVADKHLYKSFWHKPLNLCTKEFPSHPLFNNVITSCANEHQRNPKNFSRVEESIKKTERPEKKTFQKAQSNNFLLPCLGLADDDNLDSYFSHIIKNLGRSATPVPIVTVDGEADQPKLFFFFVNVQKEERNCPELSQSGPNLFTTPGLQ